MGEKEPISNLQKSDTVPGFWDVYITYVHKIGKDLNGEVAHLEKATLHSPGYYYPDDLSPAFFIRNKENGNLQPKEDDIASQEVYQAEYNIRDMVQKLNIYNKSDKGKDRIGCVIFSQEGMTVISKLKIGKNISDIGGDVRTIIFTQKPSLFNSFSYEPEKTKEPENENIRYVVWLGYNPRS